MNAAKSLTNVKWTENGAVASFRSARPGFGIVNDKGQFLSENGKRPACYISKKAAAVMAPYADGFRGCVWMDVLS